jgi:menaquinone-dependent protoporphyrinogen oxidase
MHILIACATTEGQTQKIAEHLRTYLKTIGHAVEMFDCRNDPISSKAETFDAVVLCGSIHLGNHQPEFRRFAMAHRDRLASRNGLVISVSLAASGNSDAAHAELQTHLEGLEKQISYRPARVIQVAGALKYTKYGFFKRHLMKSIARKQGLATETSRDHEYTDWEDLDRQLSEWVEGIQA